MINGNDIPPALRLRIPSNVKLTYPQQGMTSDVALVDGAGLSVAIKRCSNPIYVEWLRREHQVLKALADLDLPVPRVLDFAEIEKDGERQVWLIMSKLPGRSLLASLEATPHNRAELLARLGQLAKRLHGTPVPSALAAESPWIDRMLVQAEHNLPWCDGSPSLLGDLHQRRPSAVPEVLIHGDLALDNVLVGEDGALSLIDWSGGGQGDPRWDIALALDTQPDVTLRPDDIAAFENAYGQTLPDAAIQRWFLNLYEFF